MDVVDGSGGNPRGWWRRLPLVSHLARAVAMAALLTALYYAAPLNRGIGVETLAALIGGLLLFGSLVTWQLRAITRSEHPRLQGVEALATAVPLFLLLFASAYFLVSQNAPESFSEPLNRTDALYFTVTVFATVGFGDIVPTTTACRALTTGQMVANLIVVGFVAKLLFGAVRIAVARRTPGDGGPGRSDL
ncbi:potassium channel family protein [Streptomyces sp. NPDC002138]|uniref:potassium channel family protein n=1 Tax=Streptomyces sp. NPDC002138 TaxID=3154410 RepID=UPI003322C1A2